MKNTAPRKWWTLRLTVLAVALAIAAAVTPVLADSIYPTGNARWQCLSWGPTTPGAVAGNNYCMTDNARLFWAPDGSLTSAQVALIDTVLEREYEPTDLLVNRENPPVYGGLAQTDIIFGIRSDVPAAAEAVTWCDTEFNQERCDQHYVMFRTPQHLTVHNICHETGHAVGLVHAHEMSPPLPFSSGRLGCMASSGDTLTTEMQAEINRVY